MALKTPVQAGSGEFGNGVAQAAEDVVAGQRRTSSSGSSVRRRNSTTMASSTTDSTVLRGTVGPVGASLVVVRARHLVTVVRLSP